MTAREFVQPDRSNGFKGAVHGTMLVGAVLCCTYNAAAWLYRREPHNAVNTVLYGLLVGLEIAHVNHHRRTSLHGS